MYDYLIWHRGRTICVDWSQQRKTFFGLQTAFDITCNTPSTPARPDHLNLFIDVRFYSVCVDTLDLDN